MLREIFDSLLNQCVPGARELGLAYEAAAITARHRRVGAHWKGHLDACKQEILRGADRCEVRKQVLVIGAGACLDVPVAELAGRFSKVVLADAAISPAARSWARRFPGRVFTCAWDATGLLGVLAMRRKVIANEELARLVDRACPGRPPEGDADLIVSANCLSQLGHVPADRMALAESDDAFSARFACMLATRHLDWLARQTGVRVLLSDIARLDVARDGREIGRKVVLPDIVLRPPDRVWRWEIAPIPEYSREFHRVHEAGVWMDGGSVIC